MPGSSSSAKAACHPAGTDGAVMLEVWDADSGLRRNTIAVARLGQLRSERVWRADGGDLVVVAVRGLDRNEVALLDVRTGSIFNEQPVPFREHVMAASRDARTRVVFDRDDPRDAGLMAPGGSLRRWTVRGCGTR